jgi:hypothetical protein
MPKKGNFSRIFQESAGNAGKFRLRNTGIAVETVLTDIDALGEEETLRKYEGVLTMHDLDSCKSIAAHNMPERPEFQRNGAGNNPIKILFDENVPHRIIPHLLNDDSRLSHISFNSLTSQSDKAIWSFAKAQGFRAIVTGDSDFVRMADMEIMERLSQPEASFDGIAVSDLPLVVYISAKAKDVAEVEALCRSHMKDIIALAADTGRRGASAHMDDNGFHIRSTPREVYQEKVRKSVEHIKPERPVFDSRILDHNCINKLREKFGFSLLTFPKTEEGDILLQKDGERKPLPKSHSQIYPSSAPSPDPAP